MEYDESKWEMMFKNLSTNQWNVSLHKYCRLSFLVGATRDMALMTYGRTLFFLLLNMLFNNNYCIRQDIYRRYSVIWTLLSFFLCTNTCRYESHRIGIINDKSFKTRTVSKHQHGDACSFLRICNISSISFLFPNDPGWRWWC